MRIEQWHFADEGINTHICAGPRDRATHAMLICSDLFAIKYECGSSSGCVRAFAHSFPNAFNPPAPASHNALQRSPLSNSTPSHCTSYTRDAGHDETKWNRVPIQILNRSPCLRPRTTFGSCAFCRNPAVRRSLINR